MKFLVIGLSHQTAPLSLREKVAFAPEKVSHALQDLCQNRKKASEALILSTCNRTEIYACGDFDPADIFQWLMDYQPHARSLPCHYFYIYSQHDAIRHAMRVACGLDSMVLGEPQILGQMKSAYAISLNAKTLKGPLGLMFQYTFSAAKKIRTQTAIGQNPVSVAYAAIQLSKQIFSSLSQKTALLIGAGNTIELVYRHLVNNNVRQIIIANRTLDKACQLATSSNTRAILLGDIGDYLHQADIVISSTASQLPILGKGAVEKALKKRKHCPVLMVDIAVPRDIEPEVESLPDVYLYSVDDLKSVIEDNMASRKEAAAVAEKIILESTESFLSKLRERSAVNTLRSYRQKAEALKNDELDKAKRLIAAGKSPDEVLHQFANNLTNKLIHSPCVSIRDAGRQGETARIEWARELLGISASETLKNYETIYH